MIPEFRQMLSRQPINLFLEHEQNFTNLLENSQQLFGVKNKNNLIDLYYSELCLNVPSIYLMINKVKDLDKLWDTISAICESSKPYELTLAKVKLMQVSIGLKFKTQYSLLDIESVGNILNSEKSKDHEEQYEFIYLKSI